ncbi:hypothetical protein LTR66_010436 [Elasticomyces elasticus]|nr:hypothetical protein LTR66_010436 [Elasticomyces elasticus]KAK5008376.1 hypothetical protein LTR28_004063 [Elasticomyces elasticus]
MGKKARVRSSQAQPQQPSQYILSDYDTDTPATTAQDPAPPPCRNNEELNLVVLQRHNPDITEILSLAAFAVVYMFSSTTQQWEKIGVEGTLFVCRLRPEVSQSDDHAHVLERFAVTVLNRRGLDNFFTELLRSDDVEVTDDYVILQVQGQEEAVKVYGLWIWSEKETSTELAKALNAQIVQECAMRAQASRENIATDMNAPENYDEPVAAYTQEEISSVPMGRQLSLRELFGQKHEVIPTPVPPFQQQTHPVPQNTGNYAAQTSALLDLFRSAKKA